MKLDIRVTYKLEIDAVEFRVLNRALRGEDPKDEQERELRLNLAKELYDQRMTQSRSFTDDISKPK